MGKWLERLLKTENAQSGNPQNLQKPEQAPFVGFVGASNGHIQKFPAVWDVSILSGGKVCPMVVIDPDQMADDKFHEYLADKFGAERILTATRRPSKRNQTHEDNT